jgi:hypothetical protein
MARDAAWWREYRAEKKRREVPRAVTIDETQTVKAYAPLNVHAACDAQIADLRRIASERAAEVTRLNARLAAVIGADTEKLRLEAERQPAPLVAAYLQKPTFLAAPDEDCVCGHDRHAYHVSGACGAWVNRKRCSCQGFMADLGFG